MSKSPADWMLTQIVIPASSLKLLEWKGILAWVSLAEGLPIRMRLSHLPGQILRHKSVLSPVPETMILGP
jgi:hypothetical protein